MGSLVGRRRRRCVRICRPARPADTAADRSAAARDGGSRSRQRGAGTAVKLKPILDALSRVPAVLELPEWLPQRGGALRLGGLPGSSGAALVSWLVRELPQRLVVVVAPTPVDAERWLSDFSHLTDETVALYPQREALGEDEPHYEIAGERAETIEALLAGRLRILVTTA